MYNLQIYNFQRFKNQNMKIKGFTVLEGPSNLGKSSIRRAIGTVTQNLWESNFVSNGSKNTIINLEADDIQVQCTKGSSNEFIILKDGKKSEYKKAGKDIPKELVSSGFSPLIIGKDKINLLMARQYDPLFMVSYSDQVNTKILNTVFDVDIIEKANELVIKDIANQKRELKRELEFKDDKEKELEETHILLEKMKVLRDVYDKIDIIDSHTDCSNELKQAQSDLEAKESILAKIDKLIELNKVHTRATELQSKMIEYQSLDESLKVVETALNSLIPLYNNLCLLEDLAGAYEDENSNVNESMYIVDDLEKIDRAFHILKYLKSLNSFIEKTQKHSNIEDRLDLISKVYILESLFLKISKLNNIISMKENLEVKEEDIDSVKEGIIQCDIDMRELGICPCCHKKI